MDHQQCASKNDANFIGLWSGQSQPEIHKKKICDVWTLRTLAFRIYDDS